MGSGPGGGAGVWGGALGMRAGQGGWRYRAVGRLDQWRTDGLGASAVGLGIGRPGVGPLDVIAEATESAALAGWFVKARQPHDWLRHHITLMCGSYVSFVTAFLVVNFRGQWWPWLLPTVIGTPLITRAALRYAVRRPVMRRSEPEVPAGRLVG